MTIEKEISKNAWPCHRFDARENSLLRDVHVAAVVVVTFVVVVFVVAET